MSIEVSDISSGPRLKEFVKYVFAVSVSGMRLLKQVKYALAADMMRIRNSHKGRGKR